MATFKSITKVRIVGVLDAIVTGALLVQILCCTIYPLWKNHSGEIDPVEGYNSSVSAPTTPIPRYILVQEAMNSINGHAFNSTNSYQMGRISGFMIGVFLLLVLVFGTLPLIAAGALIKATFDNVEPDKAIQLTRFWMHSNMCTFLVSAIEFIVVLLMPILGYRVAGPLPTLLYLGIRAVFTYVVLKNLNQKMESSLIVHLNADPETCSIQEKTYTGTQA